MLTGGGAGLHMVSFQTYARSGEERVAVTNKSNAKIARRNKNLENRMFIRASLRSGELAGWLARRRRLSDCREQRLT
jgi:hypothetical protein